MTSRPGPGIYESLQHRGGGSAYTSGRWAANPQHGQQDSAWEPVEERGTKPRPKGKPIPLDAIQTTVPETVRPPPKGKPQLFFSNGVASAEELPSHVPSPANLPVPPRPGSSVPADAPQQRLIFPGGTGVKTETAVKLPGQDAPAQAVVFPAGSEYTDRGPLIICHAKTETETADLFPWIGNHPEDVLSEALVKGGISNKSQIMNETNTARPSLWPNLKNKSGLSTLSTLFVAVLEKRQSSNRLTVPNTFKPPPRLTLRDSTRETWLRDLANPTVTLRRLSRTIPHGITGKVLLEQCLNKDLPIPRAIWLIKCVGINEMRTHKRNGQAGTITWVRGWTSSVEQFLDSIITAVGQPDWKPRINYAIRLVAQLFKERLLEDDHFFDWTLKGLDSCVSERLFVWLLVVCIPDFWQDLLSSRRRGKRLAESLLEHAEKFYELEEDVQAAPVLTSLENIIIKTLATRPACFLLPTTWHRHASVLRILAERHPQTGLSHAIHDLDTRNKNLIRPCCVTLPLADDPVGQIYRLLDAVDYSANVLIDDLSYNCMEVTSNTCQLVSTVLSWASSLYRQGSHRIYLITRLLRKWNHLGADVYDAIVTCLPQLAFDQSKDTAVVFRIIAELARSKTFSPGRFLQWLIATGSLSHHRDLYSPSAWPLRLITEIPLAGLSEHVQNLRCTLLRGTVYTAEAEEQLIITTEDMICQQLPGLFNTDHSVDTHPPPVLGVLGPTVQLEVGAWLRQEVAASMEFMER
jgi:mediator of RNA polymerase II transcription subunit 12